MASGNTQKLHAKQYFQTSNSKGFVRYGFDPSTISLHLHELEYCIRKEKQRTSRSNAERGIDYDPNIYVYRGHGDHDLFGVYRLTPDGFSRVGDVEAA